MDTHANLVNIAAMRLYKYRYIDDYADVVGLTDEELIDLGVLAQEVYDILPDAVKNAGDVELGNGEIIEDFLMVNKVLFNASDACLHMDAK